MDHFSTCKKKDCRKLLHVSAINLELYKKCFSIVKIAGERDLFCDSHCPNDIVKRNETHSTQGWIDFNNTYFI